MLKTSDLKLKELVNVSDGKRLGTITDIEIDIETGRILSVVVPGPGRFLGFFGRNDDLIISWDKINKIGVDVILVEANSFIEPNHA